MLICMRLEEAEALRALRNKALALFTHPLNYEEHAYVSNVYPIAEADDGVHWEVDQDAITLAHIAITMSERPIDSHTRRIYQRITSLYENGQVDHGVSRSVTRKVHRTIAHLNDHQDACCREHNTHSTSHRQFIADRSRRLR